MGKRVPTIRERANRDRFLIRLLVWIHAFVLCGVIWFSLLPSWVCDFPYYLIWHSCHYIGPVLAISAMCQFRNIGMMLFAAIFYLILSIVDIVFLVVVSINVWFPQTGLYAANYTWFLISMLITLGLLILEALISFMIWRLRCFLLNYSNPCGRVSLKTLDCEPDITTRIAAGGAVAFTNQEIGSDIEYMIGEDASVEKYMAGKQFARSSTHIDSVGEGVLFHDESAHVNSKLSWSSTARNADKYTQEIPMNHIFSGTHVPQRRVFEP